MKINLITSKIMRLNPFAACSSDVRAAPRLPCTLQKHDLRAHVMFWQETQRATLEPVFLRKEYYCTSGCRAAESNKPKAFPLYEQNGQFISPAFACSKPSVGRSLLQVKNSSPTGFPSCSAFPEPTFLASHLDFPEHGVLP